MKHTSRICTTLFFTVALCLAVALTGCSTLGGSNYNSPVLAGATSLKLCYGVSIAQPAGWKVSNSATEDAFPRDVIEKGVAAGDRREILDMQRTDDKGATTARVYAYIVNSKRDFMPEAAAAKATPEDFKKLTEEIMQTDREIAARDKRESSMIEWSVSRTMVNGNVAIFQTGLGKRPGGTMRVLNLDVYLPNNTGLVVKLMGHPEEAKTEELLTAIMNSVAVKQ